jgi:hypothetical protein
MDAWTVLAPDAVEPAFEAARQIELGPGDSENERIIEHGLVEPVRNDQFDAGGLERVGHQVLRISWREITEADRAR